MCGRSCAIHAWIICTEAVNSNEGEKMENFFQSSSSVIFKLIVFSYATEVGLASSIFCLFLILTSIVVRGRSFEIHLW